MDTPNEPNFETALGFFDNCDSKHTSDPFMVLGNNLGIAQFPTEPTNQNAEFNKSEPVHHNMYIQQEMEDLKLKNGRLRSWVRFYREKLVKVDKLIHLIPEYDKEKQKNLELQLAYDQRSREWVQQQEQLITLLNEIEPLRYRVKELEEIAELEKNKATKCLILQKSLSLTIEQLEAKLDHFRYLSNPQFIELTQTKLTKLKSAQKRLRAELADKSSEVSQLRTFIRDKNSQIEKTTKMTYWLMRLVNTFAELVPPDEKCKIPNFGGVMERFTKHHSELDSLIHFQYKSFKTIEEKRLAGRRIELHMIPTFLQWIDNFDEVPQEIIDKHSSSEEESDSDLDQDAHDLEQLLNCSSNKEFTEKDSSNESKDIHFCRSNDDVGYCGPRQSQLPEMPRIDLLEEKNQKSQEFNFSQKSPTPKKHRLSMKIERESTPPKKDPDNVFAQSSDEDEIHHTPSSKRIARVPDQNSETFELTSSRLKEIEMRRKSVSQKIQSDQPEPKKATPQSKNVEIENFVDFNTPLQKKKRGRPRKNSCNDFTPIKRTQNFSENLSSQSQEEDSVPDLYRTPLSNDGNVSPKNSLQDHSLDFKTPSQKKKRGRPRNDSFSEVTPKRKNRKSSGDPSSQTKEEKTNLLTTSQLNDVDIPSKNSNNQNKATLNFKLKSILDSSDSEDEIATKEESMPNLSSTILPKDVNLSPKKALLVHPLDFKTPSQKKKSDRPRKYSHSKVTPKIRNRKSSVNLNSQTKERDNLLITSLSNNVDVSIKSSNNQNMTALNLKLRSILDSSDSEDEIAAKKVKEGSMPNLSATPLPNDDNKSPVNSNSQNKASLRVKSRRILDSSDSEGEIETNEIKGNIHNRSASPLPNDIISNKSPLQVNPSVDFKTPSQKKKRGRPRKDSYSKVTPMRRNPNSLDNLSSQSKEESMLHPSSTPLPNVNKSPKNSNTRNKVALNMKLRRILDSDSEDEVKDKENKFVKKSPLCKTQTRLPHKRVTRSMRKEVDLPDENEISTHDKSSNSIKDIINELAFSPVMIDNDLSLTQVSIQDDHDFTPASKDPPSRLRKECKNSKSPLKKSKDDLAFRHNSLIDESEFISPNTVCPKGVVPHVRRSPRNKSSLSDSSDDDESRKMADLLFIKDLINELSLPPMTASPFDTSDASDTESHRSSHSPTKLIELCGLDASFDMSDSEDELSKVESSLLRKNNLVSPLSSNCTKPPLPTSTLPEDSSNLFESSQCSLLPDKPHSPICNTSTTEALSNTSVSNAESKDDSSQLNLVEEGGNQGNQIQDTSNLKSSLQSENRNEQESRLKPSSSLISNPEDSDSDLDSSLCISIPPDYNVPSPNPSHDVVNDSEKKAPTHPVSPLNTKPHNSDKLKQEHQNLPYYHSLLGSISYSGQMCGQTPDSGISEVDVSPALSPTTSLSALPKIPTFNFYKEVDEISEPSQPSPGPVGPQASTLESEQDKDEYNEHLQTPESLSQMADNKDSCEIMPSSSTNLLENRKENPLLSSSPTFHADDLVDPLSEETSAISNKFDEYMNALLSCKLVQGPTKSWNWNIRNLSKLLPESSLLSQEMQYFIRSVIRCVMRSPPLRSVEFPPSLSTEFYKITLIVTLIETRLKLEPFSIHIILQKCCHQLILSKCLKMNVAASLTAYYMSSSFLQYHKTDFPDDLNYLQQARSFLMDVLFHNKSCSLLAIYVSVVYFRKVLIRKVKLRPWLNLEKVIGWIVYHSDWHGPSNIRTVIKEAFKTWYSIYDMSNNCQEIIKSIIDSLIDESDCYNQSSSCALGLMIRYLPQKQSVNCIVNALNEIPKENFDENQKSRFNSVISDICKMSSDMQVNAKSEAKNIKRLKALTL